MTRKLKVQVIDVRDDDYYDQPYRIETSTNHKNGFLNTYTCSVITINGAKVETKGLSLEATKEFIEVQKVSETHVNIIKHRVTVTSNQEEEDTNPSTKSA